MDSKTPAERIRTYLRSSVFEQDSKTQWSRVETLTRIIEHLLEGCEKCGTTECELDPPGFNSIRNAAGEINA